MNNPNEQNPFHLSAEERESMTRTFRAYMDMHPVWERAKASPFFMTLTRFPAYAFVAVLFVLTGTAYAAEASLPNDPLYPVKTRVLEPVFIQAPALSKHSKARASSTLATRRLKEANSLADQRELNQELAAYLEAEIDRHTDSVSAYVTEASQTGELEEALTVNTELETSLEAHGEVLESLNEEQGGDDSSIQDLLADIREELAEAASTGDRIELETVSSVSDEAYDFIEESQAEVEEVLSELKEEEIPLADVEGGELIEEARELLVEAEESYELSAQAQESDNRREAVEEVRDALRAVGRATILIESYEELNGE